MDGSPEVRRFFSICIEEASEDTPAIRRHAPRNVSVIVMMFLSRSDHVGTAAAVQSSKLDKFKNVARPLLPASVYKTLQGCPTAPRASMQTESAQSEGEELGILNSSVFLCVLCGEGFDSVQQKSPATAEPSSTTLFAN